MTVGVVETQMPQPQRRKAYACDVTYGTAKEFGFDFLRDRLLLRRIGEGPGRLARRHARACDATAAAKSRCSATPYFVLVDEADSILIDEARTPLIIGALPSEDAGDRGGGLQVGRRGGRRVRRRRALRIRSREARRSN